MRSLIFCGYKFRFPPLSLALFPPLIIILYFNPNPRVLITPILMLQQRQCFTVNTPCVSGVMYVSPVQYSTVVLPLSTVQVPP